MWCDNCLLIFPLRHGAMALGAFIAIYNIAGGIFLFKIGQFFFFLNYYEPQFYGGIAIAIAAIAGLTCVAMSSESVTMTRMSFMIWPIILLASAIRASLMLFCLNKYKERFAWECQHGGYLYKTEAAQGLVAYNTTSTLKLPSIFCGFGWQSTYMMWLFALIIDFVCQLYIYFMTWRYLNRLHRYFAATVKGNGMYGF